MNENNNAAGITILRFIRIALLVAAVFCWNTTPAVADDRINPQITYECDAEADVLTITHSLLKQDAGAAADDSSGAEIFSPWDMVEIDRKPDRTTIIRSSKVERACALSSGEYAVIIEPQIFSRNLSSSCGENISGAVTIDRDGGELLPRTPFESFCLGNAPIIIRISVFGKTGEYKIKRIPKYKFY